MTGPEHYATAERFLESTTEHGYGADEMDLAAYDIARAQVHATLALAAFTADPEGSDVGLLEVTP